MLFSAHVVDTNPWAALRRKTPQPSATPGLRSARTAQCAPLSGNIVPTPQLGREIMFAVWDDDDALDRFLGNNPTGQILAQGWCARMDLVRAVGVWPGLEDSMQKEAGSKATTATGPSIAITIGTAYLKTIVQLLRVNRGLEKQFLDTPNGLWGTALTNLPQRLIGTLSIWEDLDAAADYMRSGAHGAAVKEHYDPQKDPTGHTFVTGGGFFGFSPRSVSGSIGGRNPLNASLFSDQVPIVPSRENS